MIEPTTWEQLLHFVNRGGFAWNNLLGQDKLGSWTPVDASGAGLTFANVSGLYTMMPGRLVWVAARFDYPATADGSNAFFGGLPFITRATNDASRQGTFSFHSGATATQWLTVNGTRTGQFHDGAGAAVTNAQMSGTLNYVNVIYPIG
jgi:hypothetical protein